jgi:N-methylhydantoinase A
MRFAVDTGGTFTDLVVEEDDGTLHLFKAPTTPDDPVTGMLDALGRAAAGFGVDLRSFLTRGEMLVHGTTHAINAIITGTTAKTAFLTTAGHRDILVLREGGRSEPFNFTVPYPEPYIPRALSFEIEERILSDGRILRPIDDAQVIAIIDELRRREVESIAICLLWSIVRPDHEARIGELIDKHLPRVPYSLSHRLNPSLREYRRASSTAIDASLKPKIGKYMRGLEGRLREEGFAGRILIVTSQGGVLPSDEVAEQPIHLINSGPSMAPVAGDHFSRKDRGEPPAAAIVADTGGTTYDISLVRRGRISRTRDSWIGAPYRGHLTGFPSVEVRSIGAGGGSIASVDSGGLLSVGPRSAGANPGPAAYGRGGTMPTVTDAALVLGYIDPDFFLGGAMPLDRSAAVTAVETHVAQPLGIPVDDAALAIFRVVTENMVQAINDITVKQGIDPADAVLIGGGGAAGLNSVSIARRLGCRRLLIPDVGAALSAAGALLSDLTRPFRTTLFTSTGKFDQPGVNRALEDLTCAAEKFLAASGVPKDRSSIEIMCEARYPDQVWEIELPLKTVTFNSPADVRGLVSDFHALHREIFAIADENSEVEIVGWTVVAHGRIGRHDRLTIAADADAPHQKRRPIVVGGHGRVDATLHALSAMKPGQQIVGPAIIESSFTTVVVEPDATAMRHPVHGLVINLSGAAA